MSESKLLIVEDEIIIARELEVRLSRLDYRITGTAATGSEALKLAEQTVPDLVLMDIVLRGEMDGVATAAKIRQRWGIPVIYVTAYADSDTLNRAKVTAPYGYIVKPFSERELRANIEMALYKHAAETRQRNVERWFAASMQGVADGVTATDSREELTFLNPVAESITGWRREDAMGHRSVDVLRLVSRSEPDRVIDPVGEALHDGLAVEMSHDVELINRRGERIPVDYSAACLRDEDGNASGAVVVIRDLREKRRAQELLKRTQEQLLQSQKMQAIGRLAGGVAHDFNNLLTIIEGYGDILLNNPRLEPASRGHAMEILRAAERAATLTRQLLIFSRKQVGEPRVLNLNEIVADTEKMLKRLIGEDIILATALNATPASVTADPGHIEQVIVNLAVNARDAMPSGGRLTIETSTVDLDSTYALDHAEVDAGHYVMLAVSDTGCGMTAEVRERLFEPFFTTKGPGKGTGLGLATVYGIVKQSGGSVFVYSEPGQGTTFKVYLPLSEKLAAARSNEAGPQRKTPAGTETILLVEDEAALRKLGSEVLVAAGYRVLAAENAEAALALFARTPEVHLLLTDVVMPGMGGRALAERLTATRPEMKVLYVSGYTDDAVIRHGVLQEQVAFLQKPFTPHSLSVKVREVLDGVVAG